MSFSDQNSQTPVQIPPQADPRLQPTPDYGTLGPGSDITAALPGTQQKTSALGGGQQFFPAAAKLQIMVAVAGALVAIAVSSLGNVRGGKNGNLSSSRARSASSSQRVSSRDLDNQKVQKQAEVLLERAVARQDGAAEQIANRVDSWRGKLQWDSQLSALTTAALNSKEQDVRVSGVEVELAAYGLEKNEASVNSLVIQANSSDHAQKIWALWSLGLLANRGVQADEIVSVLSMHLKDADEDSRRWAVEGLALAGTSSTIVPLLSAMHDDPSPVVRERAACGLAESGMFTDEQRMTAVPQLINYSEDPSLDAQTHRWAFQALSDITRQQLPNDSAAWRNWYQQTSGQQ